MRPATACISVFLVLGSSQVFAADPQPGKLLYETHCGTCHYEKVHDRKTTKIDTIKALKAEVSKWSAQTDRRFTPTELDDIAQYLNQSHYRISR